MTADGKAGEIAKKWFGSDVMLRDPEYPRELNEEKGDASLQYILDKGELILGLDETFPPMGYRDANGDIIGFDIDLATEVCSRLGVKLKLQPINWDSKEMELNGKTIDCIWNGMSITDERINGMDLSTPKQADNHRQERQRHFDQGRSCRQDRRCTAGLERGRRYQRRAGC